MQEELLIAVAIALAILALLLSLSRETAKDYVYAAYFLICTSTFLKIRWLQGAQQPLKISKP